MSGAGQQEGLSGLLRQLRKRADLPGTEAAKRAGISQSKVSRFEHGIYAPTEAEVRRLADIYDATEDERTRLVSMAADLKPGATPGRVVLSRGAAAFQQRVGRIEKASEHVRTFTSTVVPGLLQTAAYARGIFAAGHILGEPVGDIEEAVQARLARQTLMSESGRSFTLLMSEGALRWQAHSPAVMVDQLEYLGKVDGLEHVRVGIIPYTKPASVFPMHGFDLYDRRAVIVGTETATALLTERSDVQLYERMFEELEQLASFADEAQRVLARVTADYRALNS
jgi:transcriptional regulator with XRE-family HTH domain